MKDFRFKEPAQILFGANAAQNIAPLLAQKRLSRVFVVTGKVVEKLPLFVAAVARLREAGLECTVFSDTETDPSIAAVDRAAEILKNSGCDCAVAIGGGSVIDTAKAICMLAKNEGSVRDYLFGGTKTVSAPSIPLVCVPTTAGSGSEVTASSVITDAERDIKLSVTHDYLVPVYAVLDPVLQTTMPQSITSSTGMDALTHAIEAYVSLNANPLSDAYAERAISAIAKNLRKATFAPADVDARGEMALASTMAAVAFMNGGLGAVHGIAQALGGIAHTPHGVANAILLPYVMELNIAGNPAKFARIARLMGERGRASERELAVRSIDAVRALCRDIRIPERLRDVGVERNMFDAIVSGTMGYRLLAVNPVKIREEDVFAVLDKSF